MPIVLLIVTAPAKLARAASSKQAKGQPADGGGASAKSAQSTITLVAASVQLLHLAQEALCDSGACSAGRRRAARAARAGRRARRAPRKKRRGKKARVARPPTRKPRQKS